MNKQLARVAEAIEELRRAFGEFLVEAEISIETTRTLRREIQEGRDREQVLRDMLRESGLASYDNERSRNNDPRNP